MTAAAVVGHPTRCEPCRDMAHAIQTTAATPSHTHIWFDEDEIPHRDLCFCPIGHDHQEPRT